MGIDRFETSAGWKRMQRKKFLSESGVCTIINAIIDKDVRIRDNVSIINAPNLQEKDDENYNIRDGIIVIPKRLDSQRHGDLN